MKAATARGLDYIFNLFISIHAAREGGDLRVVADKPKGLISIHAAREGGDHTPTFKRLIIFKFQSTPPVKAATNSILLKLHVAGISIHAAREGGDAVLSRLYGERGLFQSTPPVKAATR